MPVAAANISKMGGVIAADGLYLISFKTFAALTPLLTLGLGVACGWLGFGAETVFSESLAIIIIALLCGCISTLHGGLFVLGFGAVNLFTAQGNYWAADTGDQILFRLGLLVTYMAMALLAVGIPFLARALRNTVEFTFLRSADARLIGQSILGGVVYGGLVFLYLQVLPLLIRPPFTWIDTAPTVAAAYQAQSLTTVIVVIAVVGGIVRVLAETLAATSDPIGQSIALEPVQKALESKGWLDQFPLPVQMGISTVGSTVLFAGLFMSWTDVLIMAGGFLAVNIARRPLAKLVPIWPETMGRIPLLIRLPVALGVVYFLSSTYMQQFYSGTSFISIIGGSLVGIAVFALFLPPPPKKPVQETAKKQEDDEEIL